MCPCVWVIKFYTLLARAAVVVEVIVTLKLDDPREDDLLRTVDVSQQVGVVRVECRLHLGGEGVQIEVTVLRQLGIDAGVEAYCAAWPKVALLQLASFESGTWASD